MAELKYIWRDSNPPKPDVYLTRRGDTKNATQRYWDGENWWQLVFMTEREVAEGRRPTTPSPWNSKSYEPRPKRRPWHTGKEAWHMRQITEKGGGQAGMKWGERYMHYSDTEILNRLIELEVIPAEVREDVMNDLNGRTVL